MGIFSKHCFVRLSSGMPQNTQTLFFLHILSLFYFVKTTEHMSVCPSHFCCFVAYYGCFHPCFNFCLSFFRFLSFMINFRLSLSTCINFYILSYNILSPFSFSCYLNSCHFFHLCILKPFPPFLLITFPK